MAPNPCSLGINVVLKVDNRSSLVSKNTNLDLPKNKLKLWNNCLENCQFFHETRRFFFKQLELVVLWFWFFSFKYPEITVLWFRLFSFKYPELVVFWFRICSNTQNQDFDFLKYLELAVIFKNIKEPPHTGWHCFYFFFENLAILPSLIFFSTNFKAFKYVEGIMTNIVVISFVKICNHPTLVGTLSIIFLKI